MTTTLTANYGFSKITPGTEKDVWGPIYNTTLDAIDTQIKNRANEIALKANIASPTFTGKVTTAASAAVAGAGFNLPHGTAPNTPANGDIWTTTAAVFAYLNGTIAQLATDAALTAGLATKAASSHTHAQADITNLVSDLAGKAAASHTHAQADITNLVSDLAAKAPLASPTLTGTPAAPTAAPGTNTTQIATTAFVTAAVAAAGGFTAATAAEIWAGTVNTKAVTPDNAAAALNEVAVSDGATITIPFGSGINFAVSTLGGNRTLAASGLSADLVGRSGYIKFTQDGTGSRTLNTSGATWKNINAEDIVLSTAAGAVDYVFYTILSSSTVLLSIARAVG